ncbi:ATP synthase subunit I [Actinobacillus capsulatus]|uniref:ATP synthase subunit I n=1 Tax=Actinobacillus capsulatus TaxID=717 RepID=UPI000361964A|nr:F0F1 ATP synthase subunit I [Actinobacillus capsulatus]
MSAVINKAKQHYRKALTIEFGVIFVAAIVLAVLNVNQGLAFLGGSLASFLPHVLFVYWIFFKESAKNQSKMTAFYRGEGLKWLATIMLIVASLKFIPELHLVLFFVGYFVALLLNNVIPFVLSKRSY